VVKKEFQIELSVEQAEIIKTVLYFDVFNYPLTKDELFENSAVTIAKESFLIALDWLLNQNILTQKDDFILSHFSEPSYVNKRINGNQGAKEIMPLAYEYSRRIASFPFVEGVCLSGGLSKNYYDENGDIDFFIITKPNRLWICRTCLIIRYKLLPKHKKKYWCVNYFISSNNLMIEDKNVFTGTEIAYLIPTVNYTLYKNLTEKNNWYKNRFPNKKEALDDKCLKKPSTFLKSCTEFILGTFIGQLLDDALLYITLKHWQKKYPELASEDFELQFRSRKNVCKRHTKGFQNKVLIIWESKKKEFEQKFDIALPL
jgi:hypothetical protein